MRSVWQIFALVFSGSLIYAVLRYNIFGDVSWNHFPLYVINKVFALSGFLLLIISSLITQLKSRKGWFRFLKGGMDMLGFGSFVLIIIHVFLSLSILQPEYFSKFYGADGKLNLIGELSMLFGGLGLAMMWMVNRFFSLSGTINQKPESRQQFKKLINLAIIAGFMHTLIMGINSWLTPSAWYGYLPPITLLAALVFLLWTWVILFVKQKIN